MITRKCEACGKSEDYSSHFDKEVIEQAGKLSRISSKLCHDCARVWREIELEKTQIYNQRHKNMVTEVRKKLGIEPHDQKVKIGPHDFKLGVQRSGRDLQELAEEWLGMLPPALLALPRTGVMYSFMNEVANRFEEKE